MHALFALVDLVLQIYIYIVLAMVIMSWLLAFNIVNFNNQIVRTIWRVLGQLTDPVLRPIRRIMPNLGGLDISPVILLLIIYVLRVFLWQDVAPRLLTGSL